jgi:hypothetical protein
VQWIRVRCWNFVLSAANQRSLSNCSTRVEQFSLSNCGVLANHFTKNFLFQRISSLTSLCCSEPVCWGVCASTNQFADELVVQRTSLLMSLCFSKSVCWRVCGAANQFANEFMFRQINFADDSVSSVLLTNLWSSELVRWWVCIAANQFADESVCQQINFTDESMSPIFADKLSHWRVSFANELHVINELVLLPNSMSPAKQFRYWFSTANSYVRNDVNGYNDLNIWLCNMWNTWMWTCVFLENVWWRVMWLSNTNVLIVIINVLGGATGIGPSIGRGHPTGGIGRWFPPPF